MFFNAGLALVEDCIWRSCVICVANRVLLGGQTKENELDRACSTYGGEGNIQGFVKEV
jgi:hypothetical protein